MFGSLYEDDEDGIENYELPFASATKCYKYRPENCAADLETPESIRDPREFAGLKNQGATCYMNSLFQTLYMIHDFRSAILKMPLCDGNPETPSGYLDGQKYQILYCLQKLFVQLKAGRSIAASTIEVTDSFGWKNNEAMVQHDIQEATREFLGVLGRALKGTDSENLVKDIFGGVKANIIEVPGHEGAGSYREEPFEDIIVQVKTLGDLETSLKNYFMFESLNGDNQYFSEALDRKVDALKGVKVKKFPKILTVSLQRFDLDYNTFQMMKLNEEFKFPLELDMSEYLTDDSPQKGEELQYELLSCIIHIGNVGGGHYKAYIRDYASEGTWDFDLYDRKDAKEEAKKEEEKRTEGDKEKSKEEEPQEKIDYDGDFPIAYKNSELGKDWYEFNDSFVSPIVAGRLESQFGNGSSNQNAYILVYKRKEEGKTEIHDDIPPYWVDEIQKLNEKYAKDRAAYEVERNHLEIFIQPQDLFDIEFGDSLKYKSLEDTFEQGIKIKFTFDTTIGEVKEMVRKELSLEDSQEFDLFETCQLSNDLNQVF